MSFFNKAGAAPRIAERTRDMAVMRALVANGFGYSLANIRPVTDLAPDGRRLKRLVETAVTFQRLTGQQVADYLAIGEWRGKAGGYAIQGHAEAFVRFLSGSHSNVVGLPLFETAQLLRGCGWLRP